MAWQVFSHSGLQFFPQEPQFSLDLEPMDGETKPSGTGPRNVVVEKVPDPAPNASPTEKPPSGSSRWPVLAGRFRRGPRLGNGSSAEVRLGFDNVTKKRVALKFIEDDASWERRREAALLNYSGIRDHPLLVGPQAIIRNFGTKTCQVMTGPDADQRKRWSRRRRGTSEDDASQGSSSPNGSSGGSSDDDDSSQDGVDGDKEDVCVVVMNLQGPDMRQVINESGGMRFVDFVQAFRDVLEATQFLHESGLLHRDIKPENLFWDPSIRRLKLGDFGLTRKMLGPTERRLTPQMVTRWYRSPELLRGDDRYGGAVDVFSISVCAVELLTGTPLLPGQNELHQVELMRRVIGGPNHDPQQVAPPRAGGGPRGSGAWSGHDAHRPSSERTRRLYDVIANCPNSPFDQASDCSAPAASCGDAFEFGDAFGGAFGGAFGDGDGDAACGGGGGGSPSLERDMSVSPAIDPSPLMRGGALFGFSTTTECTTETKARRPPLSSSSSSTDATPLPGLLTNVSTALLLGELVDLLARMMSWEADKRPTAAEALKHPFFGLAHEMSLL